MQQMPTYQKSCTAPRIACCSCEAAPHERGMPHAKEADAKHVVRYGNVYQVHSRVAVQLQKQHHRYCVQCGAMTWSLRCVSQNAAGRNCSKNCQPRPKPDPVKHMQCSRAAQDGAPDLGVPDKRKSDAGCRAWADGVPVQPPSRASQTIPLNEWGRC